MATTTHRTRCATCGRPLAFADWTRGRPLCEPCARPLAPSLRTVRKPQVPLATVDESTVDAVPEALIEELIAALEAEAAKLDRANPLTAVFAELDIGQSASERRWAAWGFAAGFALNVGVAKWAQVASGAHLTDFIGPILVGGVLAGVTCAAIGWGLARLRQPT